MSKIFTRSVTMVVLSAFILGVVLASTACYFSPIKPLGAENLTGTTTSSPVGTSAIADIVDKTGPAVVLIETTVQETNSYDPFFNDPFFREFFGGQLPQSRTSQGMGSGFIISEDGYILTNEHVVANATKIEVIMSNKRYTAELMGSDKSLDLAVLKIDAKNLPYLTLGNSDDVRVGDWVIAIGNPYGLDHSTTVGVISAKERPVTIQDREYKNLLQTDASINPGNSGGPLLNMQGQVIGINTAVNASAQGIGFAIPTSTVSPVLETLKNKGTVDHPWVGVYIQPLSDELANYLGIGTSDGIYISDVVQGSPANQAGLSKGDVIQKVGDKKITTTKDFTSIVENSKVGQELTVQVLRKNETKNIVVTVGNKS